MLLSINVSMGYSSSGIEHAQVMRCLALKDSGLINKLVYTAYLPDQYQLTEKAGINDRDVIRLYDLVLGFSNFTARKLTLNDLDLHGLHSGHWIGDQGEKKYIVNGVARIAVDYNRGLIASLSLYAVDQRPILRDFYDARGYKALTQFYNGKSQPIVSQYYKEDGTPGIVLQHHYDNRFGNANEVMRLYVDDWTVYDRNKQHHFNRRYDFERYLFMKLLNNFKDEQVSMILDRVHECQEVLLDLKPAYPKVKMLLHLHNNHGSGNTEAALKIPNNNYEYPLANINCFDATIVATKHQKRDLLKLYPEAKVFVIPVGVVDPILQYQPLKKEAIGKVVVFSRLSVEKQLDQLAGIVAKAHAKDSRIRLAIYGYENPQYERLSLKRWDQAVSDNMETIRAEQAAGKEAFLQRFDYLDDVEKKNEIERNSEFYVLTSIMEGFNIGMMEGIGNGLIALAYNILYGPDELIDDGQNGFLFKENDTQAMVDKLVELTRDQDKAEELRKGAFIKSRQFSKENVSRLWVEMEGELFK